MRVVIVAMVANACSSPAPTCVGEATSPTQAGVLVTANSELSGLAANRTAPELLWAHGDGGANEIYAVSDTAVVHGALRLKGASVLDWEDIATAPCGSAHCIYLADTGDNDLNRATVAIHEVHEPASDLIGTVDVAFEQYVIRFADRPHNIEALFADPRDGKTYGITKVDAGAAQVFELPRVAGSVSTAIEIATFEPPSGDSRVTAADVAVDDCAIRLAIRTHDRLFELRDEPTASVATLFTREAARLPVADETQGEAIAYAADGRAYFTVSEGANSPLWRVDVQ